jgi:7,8-dihydropterin-6-yl-methyl-4-(beta-D-ribofuranosyl)aminobenzene 5'-phosphate synthase
MEDNVKKVEIIIAADNLVDYHVPIDENIINLPKIKGPHLIGEHGLAFYTKIFYKSEIFTFLFDTGSINCTILNNLAQLNLNINDIRAIVLSHGHYDHTGCLMKLLKKITNNQNIELFTHPNAFLERFFNRNKNNTEDKLLGKTREEVTRLKGIFYPPKININSIIKLINKENLKLSKKSTQIHPNVFTTGEIPRYNKLEAFSGFYCWKTSDEEERSIKDEILDDQSVFIDLGEEKGIIVMLGCTHSGLLNTLNFIRQKSDKKISCIIGGMHLVNASKERINETINFLKNLQSENPNLIIVPLHCSGVRFKDKLKLELSNVYDLGVGTKLNF